MTHRRKLEGNALTIRINGTERSVPAIASIADAVAMLGLAGKLIAVERNGEIVPRGVHHQVLIQNGDRLEIVVAVGGG